jgi:hypothetical protein
MMSRRAARATASLGALVAGLVAGLGPGLVNAAPASAAARPSTFVLHTVPAIRGVRVVFDGKVHTTNASGRVSIGSSPGPHRIHILPPRAGSAGPRVRFSRWEDGIAFAQRTISLSPGTNRTEAGFTVSRPIAVKFTDEHGLPVPIRDVSQVTLTNSVGQRFTFPPTDPPQALPANRVVRDLSGLVPLPIRYSVRDVVIDDSNVVYGGRQTFHLTSANRVRTIEVLLFPLRVEVRDALFRFPIGSAVKLILPSHARRLIPLGPDHSVLLTGLPRANYQLIAKGLGFGMTAPTTLSKPQVAKILLFSWIDVAAVLGFVILFVVGLPLIGGRIVRRHGRFRLPVWHGGDPVVRDQATVPASADPDSGDNTGEIPVAADVTDGPGTSPPDQGKAGDLAATPASGGKVAQVTETQEES